MLASLSPEQEQFARAIVLRAAKRIPAQFDRDDLMQAGRMGAVSALAVFDAARGASWRSWVAIRVTGAVLTSVRRREWIEAHHEGIEQASAHPVEQIEVDRAAHYAGIMLAVAEAWQELDQPARWLWRERVVLGADHRRVARQLRWPVQRVLEVQAAATSQVRGWMEARGYTREACLW